MHSDGIPPATTVLPPERDWRAFVHSSRYSRNGMRRIVKRELRLPAQGNGKQPRPLTGTWLRM